MTSWNCHLRMAVAALLFLLAFALSDVHAGDISATPTTVLTAGETLIRHVHLTHDVGDAEVDGAAPATAVEIFEVRGLEAGRRYEARVSFPGSPPFAYTLKVDTSLEALMPQRRGGALSSSTQRQLLDTERISFAAPAAAAADRVAPGDDNAEAAVFKPQSTAMFLRVALATTGRGRIITPESASTRLVRYESLDAAYTVVVEPLHFGVIAATMVPSLVIAVVAGLFALVVAAPALARHMHDVAEAAAELKEQ